MSSALVRQALAFVDQEETESRSKRSKGKRAASGQEYIPPSKRKHNKKVKKGVNKSEKEIVEDNIQKLIALSKPVADTSVTSKILARAVKGKPLLDKIEVKKEEYKSILFPEDEPNEN